MKMNAYRVTVHGEGDVAIGTEHHVLKGKARQTCQAVAMSGREAKLLRVEVDAEPRDILVAALDGDLEELVREELLETYVPTQELKLAPGSWGWDVLDHGANDDDA